MRFVSVRFAIAVLALSGFALPSAAEDARQPGARPTEDSGLVERTGRSLIQLDVTVRGPQDEIADLKAEDFQLAVGGREIGRLTLDNLCRPRAAAPQPEAGLPDTEAAAPPVPRARATFLFYFDQNQLTLAGRQRALDVARELAGELIVDGSRALVVSAGREVRTYGALTEDPLEVIRAIGEIEGDRSQWDPQTTVFASEESRIEKVVGALNDGDIDAALSFARQFQREETWLTGKALRLFSLAVGRLADVDPPKAVLYFADTMRSNAGEHYLSFFNTSTRRGSDTSVLRQMEMDSFSAGASFQQLLEEASAQGVRVYTVQAEGLVMASPSLTVTDSARAGRTSAGYNSQRLRDAQNSLVGLARETGGAAFLNGVRPAKIAETIHGDLACLYLISFSPEGLPEDQDLRVSLRTSRRKVELQVKGLLVIQSETKRLASRLLAAFAAPDVVAPELAVSGLIVPTGFEDGRFSALVQLAVPGSPLAGAVWDLGLSLVSRGRVREDAAGRVAVSGSGVPVIFETEMDFAPGPFELISVAHETSLDAISTGRVEGSWPDPEAGSATVGPIAVLQPVDGAFLRGTELRQARSRAIGPADVLRTDRPTALVGIVCRGSKARTLRLERRLSGDSAAEFDPQMIDFADDRCALFVDQIPAGTMTSGAFRYEVRVVDEGVELTSAVREFHAG